MAAIMHVRSSRPSLVFLSALVLLQPAFAQLSTSTITSSSASATSDLSTITSASNRPSSTTTPSSTTNNPSSTLTVSQDFTQTSRPNENDGSFGMVGDAYKYYPIIGIVVAIVLGFILFRVLKKRRKQAEAARLGRVSPYVAATPSRTRRPYRRPGRQRNASTLSMPEGVDERGEAPPPYHAGSKPPSINAGVTEHYSTEDVEMGRVNRPADNAPGYNDSGDIGDVTRPAPAVTTAPRNESTTT